MSFSDVSTVKRQQDDEDEKLSTSASKRIKLEDVTNENTNLRTKTPGRGVDRMGYPPECRPTSHSYIWYRTQFATDVKQRLAMEYKHVTHIRFLDDGVAVDWILDKLATHNFHENSQDTLNAVFSGDRQPAKVEDTSEAKEEEIPGLHLFNSGVSIDISLGSAVNPISVSESEDSDTEVKAEDISDDESAKAQQPAKVEQLESSAASTGSEPVLCDLPGNATSNVDVDVSNAVRSEASRASRRDRAVSSSSSYCSSYSSSAIFIRSSFASEPHERKNQGRFLKSTRLSYAEFSYDHYESLQRICLRNYNSTMIIQNLPSRAGVKDVYQYLQLYGLSCSEVRLHASNSEKRKPVASVLFRGSKEMRAAAAVITTGNLPFLTSSESRMQSIQVTVFPFRPPDHWRDESVSDSSVDSYCSKKAPKHVSTLSSEHETCTSQSRVASPSVVPHVSNGQNVCGGQRPKQGCRSSSWNSTSISDDRLSDSESMLDMGLQSEVSSKQAFRGRRQFKKHPTPRPCVCDSSASPSLADSEDSDEAMLGSDSLGGSDGSSSSDSDSDSEQEPSVETDNWTRRTKTLAKGGTHQQDIPALLVRQVKEVQLPSVKHGRARRLLLPKSRSTPLMTVTMRGDVQFVDQTSKERVVNLSLPAKALDVHRLEDACLVNETAILGFSRDDAGQASIVAFVDKGKTRAKIFPLAMVPHASQGILSLTPFNAYRRPYCNGDCSSESKCTFEFLSGGYDKTVQHWRITCAPDEAGPRFVSRVSPLTKVALNSKISALLHLPGGLQVLAASGQRLWSLDAEGHNPPSYTHFSNFIYQIHTPFEKNPNVFIAEVDHLYAQVQVYDLRRSRRKPVLEFGHPDDAEARHVRSQKRRGDPSMKYFVRGYQDGSLCVWDYRNVNHTIFVNKFESPVTHAIFAGRESRNLWAYTGDKVRFVEIA